MARYPEPEHSRTQFQIDRIAFFSDAVIAIALTLMFLEIKIPVLGIQARIPDLIREYTHPFLLHVIALVMGFSSISNLWIRHHSLFEHIVKYNDQLIRVNLYFLMTIMLLPISTSFLFTDNEPVRLKFIFYFGSLFLCNLSYSMMLYIIFSPKNRFSSLSDATYIRMMKNRSNMISLMFLLTIGLILLHIGWWWTVFILFPLFRILQMIYQRLTGRSVKNQDDNPLSSADRKE